MEGDCYESGRHTEGDRYESGRHTEGDRYESGRHMGGLPLQAWSPYEWVTVASVVTT